VKNTRSSLVTKAFRLYVSPLSCVPDPLASTSAFVMTDPPSAEAISTGATAGGPPRLFGAML
jgi:hypothetical protein